MTTTTTTTTMTSTIPHHHHHVLFGGDSSVSSNSWQESHNTTDTSNYNLSNTTTTITTDNNNNRTATPSTIIQPPPLPPSFYRSTIVEEDAASSDNKTPQSPPPPTSTIFAAAAAAAAVKVATDRNDDDDYGNQSNQMNDHEQQQDTTVTHHNIPGIPNPSSFIMMHHRRNTTTTTTSISPSISPASSASSGSPSTTATNSTTTTSSSNGNKASTFSSSTLSLVSLTSPTQQHHRRRRTTTTTATTTTMAIVGLCTLYIFVLYKTQHVLDQHEQFYTVANVRRRQQQQQNNNNNSKAQHPMIQPMIPLSPFNFLLHQDEIQQLVRHLPPRHHSRNGQSNQTTTVSNSNDHHQMDGIQPPHRINNNNVFTTTTVIHPSREPRQYLLYLQQHQSRSVVDDASTNREKKTVQVQVEPTDRFIIYNADIVGQGTGNLMAGLLAAHLLGSEFYRIVCLNPQYSNSNFHAVFHSIDPVAQVKCPVLLQQQDPQRLRSSLREDISIINFAGAADECEIQNVLSDKNKAVVYLVANTYPRWPIVPDHYFLRYYQPTEQLLNALPYTVQPTTVVHLRHPDDTSDVRTGLDTDSLQALGRLVPSNASTFLVTNNVQYYHHFEQCCHWSHPRWDNVIHSALGFDTTEGETTPQRKGSVRRHRNEQYLQMWVDWYTILMADDVYHTHSDFSISAIHWMNKKNHSYSIQGYNRTTHTLETRTESWWMDGETIPLVQRSLDGTPGTTNELRACTVQSQPQTHQREQEQRQQQQ